MLLTRRCGFPPACYSVAPTPRREFDTVLTIGPQTLRAVFISLAFKASSTDISFSAIRPDANPITAIVPQDTAH